MASRLDLHSSLKKISDNVYFQPPANIKLTYPCIIYNKSGKSRRYSNDDIYYNRQKYQIMVIDVSPDSIVADKIEESFTYCSIDQYFTKDNLNHTTLTLFY